VAQSFEVDDSIVLEGVEDIPQRQQRIRDVIDDARVDDKIERIANIGRAS